MLGVFNRLSLLCWLASVSLLLLVGMVPAEAAKDGVIGQVKTSKGSADLVRGEDRRGAKVGADVRLNDAVETGGQGAIGITFEDGTTLSLGPDSQLTIDDFIYEPKDSKVGFGVGLYKGTMTYVSGYIAKINPGSVKVKTPVMTIGVRGTRFLLKVEP